MIPPCIKPTRNCFIQGIMELYGKFLGIYLVVDGIKNIQVGIEVNPSWAIKHCLAFICKLLLLENIQLDGQV